jgi:hypothetical protein
MAPTADMRRRRRTAWNSSAAYGRSIKHYWACIQTHQPATAATLDMDATLIETHKRDALHCYRGFKARR